MTMSRRLALFLLLASAALLAGCFGDDRPRISIEFGAMPEVLEGKDVLIDGAVVGKLEKTGQATRISFPVEPGLHDVSLDVPGWQCVPAKVEAQLKGQKVRLMAEPGEGGIVMGEGGVGRPQLYLRPM